MDYIYLNIDDIVLNYRLLHNTIKIHKLKIKKACKYVTNLLTKIIIYPKQDS